MATLLLILISVCFVVMTYLYIDTYFKYKELKNELYEPLRKGYYKIKCHQGKDIKYTGVVSVIEIDRYKNGDSKIELIEVELTDINDSRINEKQAINYIESDFSSIMKTSDIEWLDSVDSVKEQRHKKMEKLKEIYKK